MVSATDDVFEQKKESRYRCDCMKISVYREALYTSKEGADCLASGLIICRKLDPCFIMSFTKLSQCGLKGSVLKTTGL